MQCNLDSNINNRYHNNIMLKNSSSLGLVKYHTKKYPSDLPDKKQVLFNSNWFWHNWEIERAWIWHEPFQQVMQDQMTCSLAKNQWSEPWQSNQCPGLRWQLHSDTPQNLFDFLVLMSSLWPAFTTLVPSYTFVWKPKWCDWNLLNLNALNRS